MLLYLKNEKILAILAHSRLDFLSLVNEGLSFIEIERGRGEGR